MELTCFSLVWIMLCVPREPRGRCPRPHVTRDLFFAPNIFSQQGQGARADCWLSLLARRPPAGPRALLGGVVPPPARSPGRAPDSGLRPSTCCDALHSGHSLSQPQRGHFPARGDLNLNRIGLQPPRCLLLGRLPACDTRPQGRASWKQAPRFSGETTCLPLKQRFQPFSSHGTRKLMTKSLRHTKKYIYC